MRPPLRRPLHADPIGAVGGKQTDRRAIAGRGVREGLMDDLDAVFVDDADGECVLVGVDAPDWK